MDEANSICVVVCRLIIIIIVRGVVGAAIDGPTKIGGRRCVVAGSDIGTLEEHVGKINERRHGMTGHHRVEETPGHRHSGGDNGRTDLDVSANLAPFGLICRTRLVWFLGSIFLAGLSQS